MLPSVPPFPGLLDEHVSRNVYLPPNIETERVLALLKASDEMMESLFRRSRKQTLRTLARCVKSVLNAEAAAIFLVDDNDPTSLRLTAYELDKSSRIEKVKLKIQDVAGGGLTGFIASKGEIVRLHGDRLRNHRNNAKTPTIHLKGGQGFSTLGIPLKDRKGRVLGVAKVDNKKDVNGVASDEVFFDEIDESLARVLLNKIVLILESLRNFDALRSLMEAMHGAKSLDSFLGQVMKTGIKLIGADRGDFLWWDVRKQRLVVAAQYGSGNFNRLAEWPEQSVTYEVWRTRQPILIKDVHSDDRYRDSYYEIDPSTRSEVAVILQAQDKPFGVLNAESTRRNWFDQHDVDLLGLLARYATIAVQVIGEETAFRGVVQRLSEPSPSREEVLTSILSSVASAYGLDAGIVFIADHDRQVLQGAASIGCDELNIDPKEFAYKFDENALSTKVLRDCAGYFSANPKDDPHVQRKGLEAFQITGPLVGVPLVSGTKPVGVLVSWSRQNVHPSEGHIETLEPFARLAAITIAASELERQRTKVLRKIEDILNQMQTELAVEKNLHLILTGIKAAGFDRVGVFEFKEDLECFVGLDSIGMERPEMVRGYHVSLQNPYARHICEVWSKEREAKLYDTGMFGPDPDAQALDQDPQLPWAKVPLVTAGKLYGYIAADNKLTRSRISSDSLEYLTLYGALAGQAIANHQIIEELSASKVRDNFLRQMAHTFLTKASHVKWAVDTLESGLLSYSQFRLYFLPVILKMNKQYLELGQKIREFAEIGADTKLDIVKADLVQLTQQALDPLRASILEQELAVETDFSSPVVLCQVDKVRVARAVEALLENAIKFSPKGGCVKIKIGTSGGTAYVTVTDEGRGIPPEDLRFIFDIFFRGRNAKDAHIDGTGIGLSIVLRTMELHGGKVDAKNLSERGAEFTLQFPLNLGVAQITHA